MSAAPCASWYSCGDEFQTLIAGTLAVAAAVVAFWAAIRAARLPIKAQAQIARETVERRRRYVCRVLASDFQLLSARARQAEGTIRVTIAANAEVSENTKRKTRLVLHPLIDDWESMSLLPDELLQRALTLRRKVFDHNFDMEQAGGAFGADNFRRAILAQVKSIEAFAMAVSGQMHNAATVTAQ